MSSLQKMILIIFISCFSANAQNSAEDTYVHTDLRPNIKSPEASKFEQYTHMPVNMVSGTPDISIPLYTVEYGGMRLPISLVYDASGVKVGSVASTVGLNWTLNVGGSVSRIVKGAPDEGSHYAWNTQSLIDIDGYYQDYGLSKLEDELNRFSDNVSTFASCPRSVKEDQFNYWLSDIQKGLKDSQPDLFHFVTPEGGAKFVFNDNREVVYTQNTDFIIKERFSQNSFNSWEAVSSNGIKYRFGDDDVQEQSYFSGVSEVSNQYKTNSWFMTGLSNTVTDKSISITYIDNDYFDVALNTMPSGTGYVCIPFHISGGQCHKFSDVQYYSAFALNPYSASSVSSPLQHLKNLKFMSNRVKSKVVSQITAGDIVVNFIYEDREDLLREYTGGGSPKRLKQVKILHNGDCVKTFEFKYSYIESPSFDSGLSGVHQEMVRKHLFLNSITEISCNGESVKPYKFIYNPQLLPNRLSFARDKWGYYNGVTANISLFPKYLYSNFYSMADRSVNFETSKAGILEKIIYPTGGAVSYIYENHKSDEPTGYEVDFSTEDLFLALNSQTSIQQPVSQTFKYDSNKFYKLQLSMLQTQSFSSCGKSTAVRIVDKDGKQVFFETYKDLVNSDCYNTGQSYGCSATVNLDINPYLHLLSDGAELTLKVYGYYDGGMCLAATAKLWGAEKVPTYKVGGLRVSKIKHFNQEWDTNPEKEMTYTYDAPKLIFNPKPVHRMDYDYSLFEGELYKIMSYNNASKIIANYNCINVISYRRGYYHHFSPGYDPFALDFRGPHITYQSVKESNDNSETTNFYHPYKSYFELNGFRKPYMVPYNSIPQSILAGTESSRSVSSDVSSNLTLSNYEYEIKDTEVLGLNVSQSPKGASIAPFSVYYIKGQTKRLKSQERTENFSNTTLTNSTEYLYLGSHNRPTEVITTDSKGQEIKIVNLYPEDFPANPLMQKLVSQNRIANPIARKKHTKNHVSTEHMEYISQNDTPLPHKLKGLKGTDDLNNLEVLLTYHRYDKSANPLEVSEKDGTHTVYLYGYTKQHLIAQIQNATFSEVATALGVSETALEGFNENHIGQINGLRAQKPEWMITTYTHIPLVGIKTVTDPRGRRTTYEYDNFNRLKHIKDHKGNITEAYDYNYKNQQP